MSCIKQALTKWIFDFQWNKYKQKCIMWACACELCWAPYYIVVEKVNVSIPTSTIFNLSYKVPDIEGPFNYLRVKIKKYKNEWERYIEFRNPILSIPMFGNFERAMMILLFRHSSGKCREDVRMLSHVPLIMSSRENLVRTWSEQIRIQK